MTTYLPSAGTVQRVTSTLVKHVTGGPLRVTSCKAFCWNPFICRFMAGKDSIEKSVQECRKDPGGDLFVSNTATEAKLVVDQARIHTKVMATFLSRHCTANCNVNFLFQCNAKCFVPIGAHLNGLTRFPDFVDGSIMLDGMFRDTASTEGKKCFNSPQFC